MKYWDKIEGVENWDEIEGGDNIIGKRVKICRRWKSLEGRLQRGWGRKYGEEDKWKKKDKKTNEAKTSSLED